MKILQIKTRPLNSTIPPRWLTLSSTTTSITSTATTLTHEYLSLLETINPIYISKQRLPFTKQPKVQLIDGHVKRITPSKRTMAYSILTAPPPLVKKLSEIDQVFYETDRIETGRRLDNSRWVSFIELSASARWAELKVPLLSICDHTPEIQKQMLFTMIDNLKSTDRIQGKLAKNIINWLLTLSSQTKMQHNRLYQLCSEIANKAERFNKARRVVEQWLPPYLYLNEIIPLKRSYQFSGNYCPYPRGILHKLKNKLLQLGKSSLQEELNREHTIICEKIGDDFILPRIQINEKSFRIITSAQESVTNYGLTLLLLCRVLYNAPPLLILPPSSKIFPDTFINILCSANNGGQNLLTFDSLRPPNQECEHLIRIS